MASYPRNWRNWETGRAWVLISKCRLLAKWLNGLLSWLAWTRGIVQRDMHCRVWLLVVAIHLTMVRIPVVGMIFRIVHMMNIGRRDCIIRIWIWPSRVGLWILILRVAPCMKMSWVASPSRLVRLERKMVVSHTIVPMDVSRIAIVKVNSPLRLARSIHWSGVWQRTVTNKGMLMLMVDRLRTRTVVLGGRRPLLRWVWRAKWSLGMVTIILTIWCSPVPRLISISGRSGLMAIIARRVVRWSIEKPEHRPKAVFFGLRLLIDCGRLILWIRVAFLLIGSVHVTSNEETVFTGGGG